MINRRVFSVAMAVLLATWVVSSPARADFTYDLSVTTPWTGSGSIEFNTLSGISTTDVSAFSFTSSKFGPTVDYTLSNINSISWSIDSSSGDLTSLLLTTNLIPFMTPPDKTALLLTVNTGSNPSPCEPSQSLSGSIVCDETGLGGDVYLTDFVNAAGGGLSTVPVSPVPEPASLALFAPALLGLAFFYRRKRA